MLPKIDTSISNTGGLTNRDTSFLDKLKTQGYSESSRYDLLNKARQKNGLPPIQGPVEDKGFLGTIKQQAGEIGSQIIGGIKSIPKSTGLIGKTWGDFQERAANIDRNNDTMPLGDRRTTRNIGQYLGAANDLFGNVVGSGIKTFVPKSLRDSTKDMARLGLKTEPGEAVKDTATKAYEQWKQFEKTNPELAKDLGAVGNIANFALNFVGGGQASKIKPTGMIDDTFSGARGVVDDVAGKVSPTLQKFAANVPENVSNLSTGAGEVGISAASGVSREAQQIIKQQPGLYQQARQGTITREAVTDDVVSALGKRMDDISELGKGYETIRTSSVKVPKSDIASITKQHLDELKVSKIDLPLGDRTTVQKALDYIAEYPDTLSAQNALSLRRKFDDLINWKSEATGEGKRIIRGLRAKIDNYLGDKIPGLKTLDKQYGPEREFIDKVRTSILDKKGNLKDNAISTVSNMVGKGKELKLDRFEKLLPGIGDKVRALKAFEEIQNLAQIKTGAVARQVFSFAVGGVPGFIATNPYVVGYALEKYGFAKQAIKALLSKGKNISQAEQNAVKKAVQAMTKKEAEKVIASKVGTPLLTAGKSSVATGNTGGKLPPVDLTPNASTGNAVSSQSRISPPKTAGLLDSPKNTISDKVSGTAKPKTKPVVKSAGKKVNNSIIEKLAKKQETPKIAKIDKEMLDELDKYDNAEDFARGVLKSGTKETAGMKQAKVIRDRIYDIKMKGMQLDQSSPEFAKLDKEFGRLTKELSAIDGEDALTKVLGKNEYDLEKNIETLKKFYNDNKRANLPKESKLPKKQETPKTPKTDYLNTTEAKMTDAELKSLAKKYLETSKLPVGKGRVNSDNMADYKGYARIRDYFKSQGDDSLLESKLPKTPVGVQILTKEADIKYKGDYERILKVTKEQLESNEIALKKAHNSPQSVKDTITERIGSNKREIKIAEQKLNELKANETKLPKTPTIDNEFVQALSKETTENLTTYRKTAADNIERMKSELKDVTEKLNKISQDNTLLGQAKQRTDGVKLSNTKKFLTEGLDSANDNLKSIDGILSKRNVVPKTPHVDGKTASADTIRNRMKILQEEAQDRANKGIKLSDDEYAKVRAEYEQLDKELVPFASYERVAEAIKNDDVKKLKSMLENTDNKHSRKAFEEQTGIKLGNVSETKEQVRKFFGEERYKKYLDDIEVSNKAAEAKTAERKTNDLVSSFEKQKIRFEGEVVTKYEMYKKLIERGAKWEKYGIGNIKITNPDGTFYRVREKGLEELLKTLDTKPKPSALSQKSEVKYSKPVQPEKAIKEYTNDSTKINKAIRSGDINEKALAIDKFLEQQPTYDMQTYRGLTKDADKVDDFVNKIKKEGYSDEAYTSSSKSYGDALTFSRTSKSDGKVGIILEIEGKNGKIIPSKYNAYNEEEVIYPRGSKFEFVEEYNRGGQRVVILKQK